MALQNVIEEKMAGRVGADQLKEVLHDFAMECFISKTWVGARGVRLLHLKETQALEKPLLRRFFFCHPV